MEKSEDQSTASKSSLVKCDLCNIDCPNEGSLSQHTKGQKHIKLFNAKEEQRRVEQKCGIFVRGYPPDLKEEVILTYFATYGEIVWKYFGHNFLLLDYSDPSAVEKVLRRKVQFLGGRRLTINYRQLRQKPHSTIHAEQAVGIIDKLEKSDSLSHQVHILILYLQNNTQTLNHFMKCNNICMDIQRAVCIPFPQCVIFPFGSSITGLHFWYSDIDLYISGIRRHDEDDIGYLYKLKKILSNTERFANVIVIGQAKIPILKCLHVPTNTNCDINIRNMLGVCNSKLITYYINIDNKIKEMMLIIKYWAKSHKITGQNHLFTNYSLCLMIIFYLQGNPYHLPSVKYLQRDQDARHQGTWNGNFSVQNAYCPHIRASSLIDLLCNFFSYYSNFDYGSYIICPYMGVPIEKKAFSTPENLPQYFQTYKKYVAIKGNKPLKVEASVCVQDPFEHSRNVTPVVSDSTLNIFSKFCRHGKQLCEEGERAVLYKLFTQDPPNVDVELLVKANFTQFGITMGNNFKYLKVQTNENSSCNTRFIKELWYESVKNFTYIVLTQFLDMKVEEKGDTSDNKKQKIEGQVDVYTLPEMLIAAYRCSGKLNLWHGRKTVYKNNEKEPKTVIEKETEITRRLVEFYKNSITPSVNILEFEIVLEKKLEPTQVVFNLTKIDSYKKTFKFFGEFFANRFGNWFELYERDMNNTSQ